MRNQIGVLIVLGSSVLLLPAHAQKTAGDSSTARMPEIALAYDLVGSNAPAGQCGCFVLNGGSLTVAAPIPFYGLSAVGQFSDTHAGNIGSPKYTLTLFTYTLGLRYPLPIKSKHFNLFAQGLIGGSHASGSLVGASNPGSENAGLSLAGSVGGGMDVNWKRNISIRAFEVDYQPTTFNNHTTALENNYRISAGIVFHFLTH